MTNENLGGGKGGTFLGLPQPSKDTWQTLSKETRGALKEVGVDSSFLDNVFFGEGLDFKDGKIQPARGVLSAFDNTTTVSEMIKPFASVPVNYYASPIYEKLEDLDLISAAAKKIGVEKLINAIDMDKHFDSLLYSGAISGKKGTEQKDLDKAKKKYEDKLDELNYNLKVLELERKVYKAMPENAVEILEYMKKTKTSKGATLYDVYLSAQKDKQTIAPK
ncbi:MAG: hypothetical protein KAU95_00085 [Candidatus Aenigmarchaeota archaeon]|nr:hypothetical protein [Candidatus Aenigmarchaeota archaeon]